MAMASSTLRLVGRTAGASIVGFLVWAFVWLTVRWVKSHVGDLCEEDEDLPWLREDEAGNELADKLATDAYIESKTLSGHAHIMDAYVQLARQN